jgi:phospholipid/cholesterol/gamma-HCH transport system substrate-binding protein
VEKSVVDLRYIVESIARRIDSMNQNLEGAARNMYEFSRQIRQNPGLLLGGTPPEDAAARR